MKTFNYIIRNREHRRKVNSDVISVEEGQKARRFHQTIPEYRITPLKSLDGLASRLGVSGIWVKDESKRFGLNAFKGLGGSYAIASYLAEKLGTSINEIRFEELCSKETKKKLGPLTFVTATDGNHGRGVAWAARVLGHKAVVYMPKGSEEERLMNIRAQGAEAEITDLVYDDAVRLAKKMAEEKGWILIQDTAWDGYEDVPAYIMQGYTTIGEEIREQLGDEKPTHLFLQAGVGSFAGALLGYFTDLWGIQCPKTVIIEPDAADCHYRSAKADDGKLHFAKGELNSMMAGLCCGEPCTISWKIIDAYADGFLACSDEYCVEGMRLLGIPEDGDPVVVSGESGAIGVGVLAGIMKEENLRPLKEALGLDENSKILLISTEGDTDRKNYKRIVG
ncbi:MAG: diaminopropionate ammonia-lyase [Lachnospiraceae bacterium]|nr:diaminopropionate ammonia-lyase [Lachnospiraceae bacterium]